MFVPLGVPNDLSLQSPVLAYCPNLVQSQVQPSQVSGCQFNRAPGQARPVGIAGSGRPLPPRLPALPGRPTAWHPMSFLYLGVSPFCRQKRLVWKCSFDSPVCGFNESSNPGLFSQRHLESSPHNNSLPNEGETQGRSHGSKLGVNIGKQG